MAPCRRDERQEQAPPGRPQTHQGITEQRLLNGGPTPGNQHK